MTDIASIPIDIHANRLLDWLISRHHCNKEWPDKIATIRQKINSAIEDMPEHATIAKILAGASPINYYHCVKIVEVLKETEAETKNIFGSYGSRRMKDWQDIIKSYQKENLYICESASILARNVIYEVPALKRLINKLEQAQSEAVKKEAACKKQAQDYRDKFSSSCKQLGLHFDPQNSPDAKPPSVAAVGKQLINQSSQELPAIFDKISNKAKEIREAVLYYQKFLENNIALSEEDRKESLGLLLFVIEKGNLTTYEFKHKEPPLKIEVPELNYSFDEDEQQQSEVEDAGGEIDFGDLDTAGGDIVLETGDIDWGDIEVGTDTGAGDQIDFSLDDADTVGIVVEEDGIEGGVARKEEALSVLENPDTREQFINEILELEGFLSQRIDETKALKPNEVMLTTQDDSLSLESLEKLHKSLNQLYTLFNENKTKQFLLVRESKRFLIRTAESLLQNLRLAKKADFLSEEAKSRGVQCAKEADEIRPKIQTLTKQCRELQAELAKEISSMYNNRTVYITGGL